MKVRKAVDSHRQYQWYEFKDGTGNRPQSPPLKRPPAGVTQEITDEDYRSPSMPCPPLEDQTVAA